jgi:hypothetical protein
MGAIRVAAPNPVTLPDTGDPVIRVVSMPSIQTCPVAAERAPVPNQPFQRGLQQILAGLVAAREQDGCAHQPVGAVSEEALKLPDSPVIRHPPASLCPSSTNKAARGFPKGQPDWARPRGPSAMSWLGGAAVRMAY